MKDQYKAVMIFRDETRMLVTNAKGKKFFSTKEEAKKAIEDHMQMENIPHKAGMIIIEVQEYKNSPSDIIEYKIYKRQITPWEEV